MVFNTFLKVLGLSDIGLRLRRLIFSDQDIECWLVQFLLLIQIGQVRTRNHKHLTNLVADKCILRPLWISVNQICSYCFAHVYNLKILIN